MTPLNRFVFLFNLIFPALVSVATPANHAQRHAEKHAQENMAVILVPGAFHKAIAYEQVIPFLEKAGYKHNTAVDLPSVGALKGRDADIKAVRDVLSKGLSQGYDTLLVGNSYGATVIGEAVKGLQNQTVRPHCRSASKFNSFLSAIKKRFMKKETSPAPEGRILGLLFLAGYIPFISEIEHPELKVDIRTIAPSFFAFSSDGKVTPNGDPLMPLSKSFYNHLNASYAAYWTDRLDFSSFEALAANATHVPYMGDFNCAYVVCTKDNAIPKALSDAFLSQGGAKFKVVELESDHVPMLSHPEEVADLIREAAGEQKPFEITKGHE
ncbi:alpha/beta-hydrolase [Amniculicola lignicola CBS 123094]|uniref:Alpha/beta-hydrolase n=1 Tax=Amniculicola lignicola CBS 123094 TaxID=1392246 RepID=A0A6A5WMZ0_9PLEO|nr:alpha/beta-hydrolase [Amniculicola lignicola CBS 123094]